MRKAGGARRFETRASDSRAKNHGDSSNIGCAAEIGDTERGKMASGGRQKMMRRMIFGFCCLVALQCIAASAFAQQTVKVGLLMTYTGQFTDAAAQMDDGIKLYMKEHGDVVAGKKIEVMRRDTAGAGDAAKRLAQELIVNDNVDILAGFVITPEALAVANLSAEAKANGGDECRDFHHHHQISLHHPFITNPAADFRGAGHLGAPKRGENCFHYGFGLRAR